jgi:hypothetical protein
MNSAFYVELIKSLKEKTIGTSTTTKHLATSPTQCSTKTGLRVFYLHPKKKFNKM